MSFLQSSAIPEDPRAPQSITPPHTEHSHAYSTVSDCNDMDMDMGMDGVSTPAAQHALQPGTFHPDVTASTISGRMPTPIQPSFATQVRGNNWGGAAGNLNSAYSLPPTSTGFNTAGLQYQPSMSDSSVPRTIDNSAMNEWSTAQNRSLPSPISEGACEEMQSPGMVLDGGSQGRSNSVDMSRGGPARSHSSLSLPMDMRERDAVQTHDISMTPNRAPAGMEIDMENGSLTPSPSKKGHTRSRHTVNNWTQQPGMKKSFSIGYRSDCEKCRNKVPGHFNHIIVS